MGDYVGKNRVDCCSHTGLYFDVSAAFAHPHVWITVRSHVEFTPDGNVGAIIHDWVFDEMYSSFATQGLAPKGQLVTRENAGSIASDVR